MAPRLNFQAVILGAGSSSRMGCPKQLLEVDGITMLDRTISAVLQAGLTRPVLVLGAHRSKILQSAALASCCRIIVNEQYETGQASSLIAGVNGLHSSCDAAIFLLCDQPLLTGGLIGELVAEFDRIRPDILYPLFRKQRGNPVILAKSTFPRLLQARGDRGARFLFNAPDLTIHPCEVDDEAVIIDVDTPEEYRALVNSRTIV
ncbi:nucleotidyltransferase family protein [Desulforhopalus singaporensis]|uniref:Molybdenum cofactor cytidylyltransferase n=1 Tax=Desulforhopalus singaporensis TaxID=91360 RepID=A0A1H0KI82_9BACT|nr:nucleotidyltransferase family protein [Desulforhopalus singaporensis]SDO55659.1 molybdenum cofactor cytidylyltransferase [Desulforhopalus singaporensis]